MGVETTRYAVPGWGVGELWSRGDGTVVSHHFEFGGEDALGAAGGASDRLSQASSSPALVQRFRAFLAGEDVSFSDVAIDLEWATPLQAAIVEELRRVPRGEVVSYGELAALAGGPGAPRAAGAVCAANRFAFIVPCHRVVSANGIGGYGSTGVETKRRLLALEGVHL
jgi:methylated-DNA-[protein]-cysteine S-methyltransferase